MAGSGLGSDTYFVFLRTVSCQMFSFASLSPAIRHSVGHLWADSGHDSPLSLPSPPLPSPTSPSSPLSPFSFHSLFFSFLKKSIFLNAGKSSFDPIKLDGGKFSEQG